MPGAIRRFLEEDHARIEDALRRATSHEEKIEPAAYAEFRAALLRHIGMEEKILMPAARAVHQGRALPALQQLHLDHGALAALLVPTPTPNIVATIGTILSGHNAIEEGPGGVYDQCEGLQEIAADLILQRLQSAPPVAVAPHVDNPTAMESMYAALQRAGHHLEH